ncbi:type IV secretory system conjugative DNA transfer family protein [Clostridium sp. DMHC 10]|uniref:type IV secretory system conjugative DNA transfer family protein n=1 Tax=Clostridium sp. DMHC 10 TaxID=747377 RepID=UPI00241C21A7|nr:type IV secretory system conjugative DNA transfer family protein [Clostridium sp. DMHC 10]
MVAPTREGKTTSVFIPNLLENNLKGSIVIADPKQELYEKTHKYQESIGRKTILYNPFDMKIQYNPIKNCKNDREIIEISQNLLINGALSYELQTGKKSGGLEWIQSSQGLFTALLCLQKTFQRL